MKKFLSFAFVVLLAGAWGFLKFKTAKNEMESAAAPENRRTLHVYAMSDYFPSEVIKEFETANNCEVKYDNFSNNEELLAKLQAGARGYDIIVPSDYAVRALIESKLIKPLDHAKLPNFKNLGRDFTEVPYDPGSKHSVAYTWGTSGLVYNTKFVKEPVESWDVLFKKEYVRKIALLDDSREVLGAMLRKLGYSTNTVNMDELKAAKELLLKLKPSVRLFSSDPKQHLLSGDVWIAHTYSGDAQQIIKDHPEYKYITPKEGGVIFIDAMAIPEGAPNEDLAYKFINNILQPEVGLKITEELRYSSPNTALESLLKDETLKASSIRKVQLGKLEFLKDLGAETEKWDRAWSEAKTK
ncbi:MAG: spermidine/putrescine ABC transporter substrate-binding protein [Oligoflexia bacterium]|nr:spermidine/putrescine ABC transporter substrate-binding protein [Oligoflexia bacterium]